MSARIRIGVLSVLFAALCLVGCKRENSSDSTKAPEPVSTDRKANPVPVASEQSEADAETAKSGDAAEATKPAETMKDEPAKPATPPAEPVAPAPRKLTLGDVTPVQAERAIREVLKSAVGKVGAKLGAVGGIGGDPDRRIPAPKEWASMETAIRKVNREASVDAWLNAINNAAEKAAADVKPKLEELVSEAALRDAKNALTSSADGATQAFLNGSEDGVKDAIRTSVERAVSDSDATALQETMLADARFANPFTHIKSVNEFSIVDYLSEALAERMLVGMAREEQSLRDDPSGIGSETAAAVLEAAR